MGEAQEGERLLLCNPFSPGLLNQLRQINQNLLSLQKYPQPMGQERKMIVKCRKWDYCDLYCVISFAASATSSVHGRGGQAAPGHLWTPYKSGYKVGCSSETWHNYKFKTQQLRDFNTSMLTEGCWDPHIKQQEGKSQEKCGCSKSHFSFVLPSNITDFVGFSKCCPRCRRRYLQTPANTGSP